MSSSKKKKKKNGWCEATLPDKYHWFVPFTLKSIFNSSLTIQAALSNKLTTVYFYKLKVINTVSLKTKILDVFCH